MLRALQAAAPAVGLIASACRRRQSARYLPRASGARTDESRVLAISRSRRLRFRDRRGERERARARHSRANYNTRARGSLGLAPIDLDGWTRRGAARRGSDEGGAKWLADWPAAATRRRLMDPLGGGARLFGRPLRALRFERRPSRVRLTSNICIIVVSVCQVARFHAPPSSRRAARSANQRPADVIRPRNWTRAAAAAA